MTREIRVRFAPSPTGELHLGGARTAIYNWAFAKAEGGTFILRIDDTDPERSTEENTQQILSSLRWMGLDWDEGPEVGGDYGPYFQTQRAKNYERALSKMIEEGSAYPCFCTPEDLAAKREAARKSGGYSGYDRTCRNLNPEEVQQKIDEGIPHVWRLAVPLDRETVVVDDIVRGKTTFPIEAMDDFVLARTDRTPTYNFASVVDDGDMKISHIIRGDDHLSNTPRQILVFEALGYEVPNFAHLSMIYGADHKKLSKRHGATGVEEYKNMGYLPEALLNYLALLGWSLDGETTIIPREVLAKEFSLERISKNPAVFDLKKLEWINGQYLNEMEAEKFAPLMVECLAADGLCTLADFEGKKSWFTMLAPLVSERIKLTSEIADMVSFLFVDEIEVDERSYNRVLAKDGAVESLTAALNKLESLEFSLESIEAALADLPAELELKPRVVFQSLRVALTGTTVSPPLFESIALLGKEKTIERIKNALALIEAKALEEE